jgi:hypothetical protein
MPRTTDPRTMTDDELDAAVYTIGTALVARTLELVDVTLELAELVEPISTITETTGLTRPELVKACREARLVGLHLATRAGLPIDRVVA